MDLMFGPAREQSITASQHHSVTASQRHCITASASVINPSRMTIQTSSLVDLARFREGMEPLPELMM